MECFGGGAVIVVVISKMQDFFFFGRRPDSCQINDTIMHGVRKMEDVGEMWAAGAMDSTMII